MNNVTPGKSNNIIPGKPSVPVPATEQNISSSWQKTGIGKRKRVIAHINLKDHNKNYIVFATQNIFQRFLSLFTRLVMRREVQTEIKVPVAHIPTRELSKLTPVLERWAAQKESIAAQKDKINALLKELNEIEKLEPTTTPAAQQEPQKPSETPVLSSAPTGKPKPDAEPVIVSSPLPQTIRPQLSAPVVEPQIVVPQTPEVVTPEPQPTAEPVLTKVEKVEDSGKEAQPVSEEMPKAKTPAETSPVSEQVAKAEATGEKPPVIPMEEVLASPIATPTQSPAAADKINDLVQQVEQLKQEMSGETIPSEKASATPLPLSKEVLEGHATVKSMRSQLEQLLQKLNPAKELSESSKEIFLATTTRVREAADAAIAKLQQMDLDIDSPSFSLDTVRKSANDLPLQIGGWENEINNAKSLTLQAEILAAKIQTIDSQLVEFSEYIQNLWKTEKERVHSSPKPLSGQIAAYEEAIETILNACKKEVGDLIAKSKHELEKEMDVSQPASSVNRQNAIKKVRNDLLIMRKEAWSGLDTRNLNVKDLKGIIACKNEVATVVAFDNSLLSILNFNEPYDLISLISSFMTPQSVDEERRAIDDVIAEYIKIGISQIWDIQPRLSAPSIELRKVLNDLSAKQRITLEDFAKLQMQVSKEKFSSPDDIQLQHYVTAIQMLLDCSRNHHAAMIKELEDQYTTVSSISSHASLKGYINAQLKELSETLANDTDLNELPSVWKEWRKLLQESHAKIDKLTDLARIQLSYQTLLDQTRAMKLTGQELVQAEAVAQKLETEIADFIKFVPDDYKKALHANRDAIKSIQAVEDTKNEHRQSIDQRLTDYLATLQDYIQQADKLNKHFGVEFNVTFVEGPKKGKKVQMKALDYLNRQKEEIETWKKKGRLPPIPSGWRLSKCCRAEVLPEEVSIDSLDSSTLVRYLNWVKGNIEILKTKHSEISITSMADNLDLIVAKEKEVNARVSDLREESRFQYGSAHKLQNEFDAYQVSQKDKVKANPNLKELRHQLLNDLDKLKFMLVDYPLDKNEKLLDQMEEYKDNAEMQKQIRKTFKDQSQAANREYQTTLRSKLNLFSQHPELYKEANQCVEEAVTTFTPLLEGISAGSKIKDEYALNPEYIPIIISFEAMTIKQAREYNKILKETFETAQTKLDALDKARKKFEEAYRQLNNELGNAQLLIHQLDQANQLIAVEELTTLTATIRKDWDYYLKNFVQAEKEDPKIKEITRCCRKRKKIIQPDNTVLGTFGRLTERVGRWTGQLKSMHAKMTSKLATPLSIQDQLEGNSTEKQKGELMVRYQAYNDKLIDTTVDRLKGFQTRMDDTLKAYISRDSSFYKDTTKAISDSIEKLNSYRKDFSFVEKKYLCGNRIEIPCLSKNVQRQIRELTPQQLRQHQSLVETDAHAFVANITSKLPIEKVSGQEEAYKKQLETAKKKVEQLETTGHYWDAYTLQKQIDAVEARKPKDNCVTSVETMRTLSTGLESCIETLRILCDAGARPVLMAKEQLKNFLNLPPKEKQKTKTLQHISSLRNAVIKIIYETIAEYDKEVAKIREGVVRVKDLLGLPPAILKEHEKAIDEAREKKMEMMKFEVTPAVPGTLGTRYGFKPAVVKLLDDLTAEEIININPDTKVKELCKQAKIKISERFPFKDIVDNYTPYEEALEEAKSLRDEMTEKNQYLYRTQLEETVSKVKEQIEAVKKKGVVGPTNMREMAQALKTQTAILTNEIAKLQKKDDLSIAEQIKTLLDKSAASGSRSTLAEQLKPYLVEEILTSIKTQTTKLDEYIKKIDDLSEKLKMPLHWKNALKGIFEKQKETISTHAKGLDGLSAEVLQKRLEKIKTSKDNTHSRLVDSLETANRAYQAAIAKAKDFALELRNSGVNKASGVKLDRELTELENSLTQFYTADDRNKKLSEDNLPLKIGNLSSKLRVMYGKANRILTKSRGDLPTTYAEQVRRAQEEEDYESFRTSREESYGRFESARIPRARSAGLHNYFYGSVKESLLSHLQRDEGILAKAEAKLVELQSQFDLFAGGCESDLLFSEKLIYEQANYLNELSGSIVQKKEEMSGLVEIDSNYNRVFNETFSPENFQGIVDSCKIEYLSKALESFIYEKQELEIIIQRHKEGSKSQYIPDLQLLLKVQTELFINAFANLSSIDEVDEMETITNAVNLLKMAKQIFMHQPKELYSKLDPWTNIKSNANRKAQIGQTLAQIRDAEHQIQNRVGELLDGGAIHFRPSEDVEVTTVSWTGINQNLDLMSDWMEALQEQLRSYYPGQFKGSTEESKQEGKYGSPLSGSSSVGTVSGIGGSHGPKSPRKWQPTAPSVLKQNNPNIIEASNLWAVLELAKRDLGNCRKACDEITSFDDMLKYREDMRKHCISVRRKIEQQLKTSFSKTSMPILGGTNVLRWF